MFSNYSACLFPRTDGITAKQLKLTLKSIKHDSLFLMKHNILEDSNTTMPVPGAARSKAWVCDRSPTQIVGSNPTGGMDVCCECCVLSGRGLCDELITRSLIQMSPTDCGELLSVI